MYAKYTLYQIILVDFNLWHSSTVLFLVSASF